jgi:mannose-6-phosphate isomerase-like protein (cupin superfamily)
MRSTSYRYRQCMPNLSKKSFADADEVRTPDRMRMEKVTIGPMTATRLTMSPGWRWSESVGTTLNTERCHERHVGVVLSGRLAVDHDDGTRIELTPGDAYVIEPGHDGVVVGDEEYQAIQFDPAEE